MPPIQDLPVLDVTVVQSLRELGGEDDPNLFRDLIELFVTDARANVDRLRDAFERQDVNAVYRVAHAIKSSAANVGAARMSKLCFEIEKLGREGVLAGAGELVTQVRQQFEEVSAALRAVEG